MGRNQLQLLRFAINFPYDWHSYRRDKSTIDALNALASKGLIKINNFQQFRLALPESAHNYLDSGSKAASSAS